VNLLTPIPLATIGWIAAIAGGLTVTAYILKMRRRRFEVPFSTLWHRVLREKEATSLWRRLKRWLSLLLALLILGMLLFAALEPELGEADDDAQNVVILLDASASMKAVDAGDGGEATRMEAAIDIVEDLLGSLGGGDAAMVMRMDGQTTPLTRFESDMPKLARMVREVEASDTPADLRRALSAAADALRDRKNPHIILVGDGAYDEAALDSVVWKKGAPAGARLDGIDLTGIDVRYVPVGTTGENVGIIAFNARRYATDKTSYEVYIEVQNFGKKPARRKLVLYNGDVATDVRTLELKPGEKLRQIYSRGGGEDSVLRASLEVEQTGEASGKAARRDAFPLDDEAWALLPARRKQKVLLVTEDNLFLEAAMLVYDNVEVDKLTPADFDAEVNRGTLPEYSAVVLDRHAPANLPPPPTGLIYFHPQGEHAPFKVKGEVTNPHITDVAEDHPVMRWVSMGDVHFDRTSVLEVERGKGQVVLASSVRNPIIAAVRTRERKIVACGFPLDGTDFVLRVGFPLLLVNAFDWFAADEADLMTTYATGSRVRVPMDGVVAAREAEVTSPTGRVSRAPLADGFATFYASEVGVHRVAAKEAERVTAEVKLAANLSSPTESDIAPSTELNAGGQVLKAPEGFSASHRRSIWIYLVLAVVLLLCIEWVTFNRRVTV
jgi:Ca-activated chloride channel homolog